MSAGNIQARGNKVLRPSRAAASWRKKYTYLAWLHEVHEERNNYIIRRNKKLKNRICLVHIISTIKNFKYLHYVNFDYTWAIFLATWHRSRSTSATSRISLTTFRLSRSTSAPSSMSITTSLVEGPIYKLSIFILEMRIMKKYKNWHIY